MTDGLSCSYPMPLAWHPASLDEHARHSLIQEATLLLNALNQMEGSHELEAGGAENRRLERLEAKLDLALHLLTRTLEPGPVAATREVILSPLVVEWNDEQAPAAGTRLVLELRPSEHLPLTLRLPALAREPLPGLARASLENLPQALDDALHQFVFRRHRQAIRARTGA
jgi:hypothetical protein